VISILASLFGTHYSAFYNVAIIKRKHLQAIALFLHVTYNSSKSLHDATLLLHQSPLSSRLLCSVSRTFTKPNSYLLHSLLTPCTCLYVRPMKLYISLRRTRFASLYICYNRERPSATNHMIHIISSVCLLYLAAAFHTIHHSISITRFSCSFACIMNKLQSLEAVLICCSL